MDGERTGQQVSWRQRSVARAIAWTWPKLAKLQNYRAACLDESFDPAKDQSASPALFLFWHEFLAVLCPQWAHCQLTLLISQHRDGEWINQVAVALGYKTARGSSTRGGTAALRQLAASARENSIVMTPDGPRGPRRQMSQGAAYLGAKLQIPIIPVGVGVRSCWRLNTWDQAPIPKPGGQIRVPGSGCLRGSVESSCKRTNIDCRRPWTKSISGLRTGRTATSSCPRTHRVNAGERLDAHWPRCLGPQFHLEAGRDAGERSVHWPCLDDRQKIGAVERQQPPTAMGCQIAIAIWPGNQNRQ